jgi:hypothetical protein
MVVEVTEPFDDIVLDRPVERLQIEARLEGELLGLVELPTTEGRVRADAVRASIADRFAWIILARYFARTAYARLDRRADTEGWSWWRGGRLVARVRAGSADDALVALHDAIGWTTLLEALWPAKHPLLDGASRTIDRLAAVVRRHDDGREHGMPRRRTVAVGARSPAFILGRRNVAVELRIGSAVVTSVEYVVGPAGIASGRALRDAVTAAAGASLYRAVVREALLGAPLDATSLPERLARGRARAI